MNNATLHSPFVEIPAKWTGNGSRLAKPNFDDWYETVREIEFWRAPLTVQKDFPDLPSDYAHRDYRDRTSISGNLSMCLTLRLSFKDIALFWLDKGVRWVSLQIMAEMVPVEFLELSQLVNQDAKNQCLSNGRGSVSANLYRDYIHLGKMDYLCDKSGPIRWAKPLYESKASTAIIPRFSGKWWTWGTTCCTSWITMMNSVSRLLNL